MSRITTIKDITIPVLKKTPHFEPRYSPDSVDFYLNKFMKPQSVEYLMSIVCDYNNNINFKKFSINEIESPQVRLMIKEDIINVMDDAILETFYNTKCLEEATDLSHNLTIEEEYELFVEDGPLNDEAKKRLQNTLCKFINELVFKRTANYNTHYGFI